MYEEGIDGGKQGGEIEGHRFTFFFLTKLTHLRVSSVVSQENWIFDHFMFWKERELAQVAAKNAKQQMVGGRKNP